MSKPAKTLYIHFREPPGGYDPERLAAALNLLISKQDLLDFFSEQTISGQQVPPAGLDQETPLLPQALVESDARPRE